MVNREIKFRVWDMEQLKFWSTEDGMYFRLSKKVDEKLAVAVTGFLKRLSRFHVQQYTGVRDVDGKEIYEGDYVVLDYNHTPRDMQLSDILEVVFDRGSFALLPRKMSKGGTFAFDWMKYIEGFDKHGNEIYRYEMPPARSIYDFNICRAVGNVYENPELIK